MTDTSGSGRCVNGNGRVGIPTPGNKFQIPGHHEIVATEYCIVDGDDAVMAKAPTSRKELYRIVDDRGLGVRVDYHDPTDDGREWVSLRRVQDPEILPDCGVAPAAGLVCQNFEAHDEEITMVSGPHAGVRCPECGRMAGGPDEEIPYIDPPYDETGISHAGGKEA